MVLAESGGMPWIGMISVMISVIAAVLAALAPDYPPAGAGDVGKGKRLYYENCKQCHGSSGRGDGYTKFNPPPADLTSQRVRETMDAGLIKTIHGGRANTAMGTWRLALSDEEIEDVVAYIRTLGEKP
jgi:mono/diheme cytochrome c family protein